MPQKSVENILTKEYIMQINFREYVYVILHEIEKDTLNNTLAKTFSKNEISTQDKALITNLVYQVLRYKLRLESLIKLHSHKDDLNKNAHLILLIALCEMFFMTSIPVHASINEAVNLAKKHAPKEVALVNAVLRKIDKIFPDKELDEKLLKKEIKFLYPKKTLLEQDATYASLPSFLLDIVRKQYGRDFAQSYLNTMNDTPWYSYRFNASKENVKTALESFMQTTSLFKELSAFGLSSAYKLPQFDAYYEQGLVSMQGASSQLLTSKIKPFIQDKKTIWDCCCGVGGKSIPLVEQGIHISYASDINEKRIEIYKKELDRLGLESKTKIFVSSLQDANIENVDCIILDAPCSGTGTLNANPDLRYKITKNSIKETIELQKELLEVAYSKLTSNGVICYITCSLNKNENELLLEEFIKEKALIELHSEYIFPTVSGADTLYLAVLQKQ